MTHDEPVTALGLLTLLIAKCDSSAEMAYCRRDGRIFRELAKQARKIDKVVYAERRGAINQTLAALQRIKDTVGGSR